MGDKDGQLLCFCDASAKAYATCVYLRCVKDNEVATNWIFSKSRVSPEKAISVPRLELLAVLIGVRYLDYVKKNLELPIRNEILWTDSQGVLHWLKNKKQMPVFVKNRINEIRKKEGVTYRYIHTSENPADLATRGKEMWWHGPEWVKDLWPNWNVPEVTEEQLNDLLEVSGPKNIYEVSNLVGENNLKNGKDGTNPSTTPSPFGINEKDYSSLSRLLCVSAYAKRFVENVKKGEKFTGPLSSDEIEMSRKSWIRYIQQHDAEKLKDAKLNKKDSQIRQLGLALDGDGIIRCHGRLTQKTRVLGENEVYPIYIPNKCYFGELLIRYYHNKLLHSGTAHTLSRLRNEFWIPMGRRMVHSVIMKCCNCRRFQDGPFKMPDIMTWPAKKVTRSPPFTYTGLDYLGPLYVKSKKGKKKVWVSLFTCIVVRAIHLKIVSDMSADMFLLALRRFVSRRGKPDEIILDNASQFKVTKDVVDASWKKIIQDESVYNYTSMNGIKWNFITEFAPWEGGFYERLVGMVKSCIRKCIGRVILTKDQLNTFMIETEAVINSRPLVYVDDDINSKNVITPGHFISMISTTGTPDVSNITKLEHKSKQNTAKNLLEFWKKWQHHLDTLWDIWKKQIHFESTREIPETIKINQSTIESQSSKRSNCTHKR